MNAQRWNPRFVAFALANGHTPEEQYAIDQGGTHALEFILWMSPRIAAFEKARGELAIAADPDGFDSFLLGGLVGVDD